MSARLVVIGGGAAGTAAAWAASDRADVTLIDGGVGATSLSSGGVDDQPWDAVLAASQTLGQEPLARRLEADLRAFVDDLGLWSLPEDGPMLLVATTGGVVRIARGIDRSLLDLRALRGRRVLLPRADRASWDAEALARIFTAVAPPELALRFEASDAAALRFDDERRIADAEIAGRHDDPSRLRWLADELGRARDRAGGDVAFLLGPWLGASAPRASSLSEAIGVPVGEALSGWPGAPGLRFEAARDALLARKHVSIIRDRVTAIEADGGAFKLLLRDGSGPLRVPTVIVATGGLVGGGIVFDPPEHGSGPDGARAARSPYRLDLTINLPVELGSVLGTMHGPALEDAAWPALDRPSPLEHVGLHCDETRIGAGLFAAGDVVAGRPRTILQAVASGLQAGRRSVQD